MKNKIAKYLPILAVALSLTLIGTACSNNNSGENASATNANAAGNNAAATNSDAANNASSADETVTPENAPVAMSGVFNGVNDDKTIEIETGVGAVSYKVSSEIADTVAKWEKGTNVTFEYKEDTITKIDKE
ncbi:hypothetical protein [Paenibacillus sp. CF384]|uniref:hypothetical protein n=1 Tax=Paenibacillus sp. CF384 TaxID=1884382 RepID=UPI00089C26D7|nr:hypothetical protein [Paenibacillus sp. CF384]SDX08100.1 hypothetical protein SAMN05518855_1008202 [Paenibacillus sp. CF384]